MADTQINVGMNVDGVITGTEKAKRSLKDLGGAASEAGKAAGKVGDGTDAAAAKIERDTRRISNEFKRLQVAAETAGKSLSESMVIKANAYGVPLASIQAQIDGAKAFEKAQIASNAALLNGSSSLQKVGMSAAATSAALRNVPAQFTDIVTSLQGGQKPMTVLLQQGGQLKDMFGGVGGAARALGGYVLGMVNPITLAAAAAATLGYAFIAGRAESEAYNKALILTGSSAGTTAVQLSNMAQAVSKATGGTVGAAADALAQLAGAGGIASAQFEKVAATAVMMEKATGVAVSETVKQFSELGKDPLNASIKINESTKFLTLSVYEQIKALTEQGRTLEAGVVAQNAFYDVNQQRTTPLLENLSRTTQAYKILAGWVGKVADAAKEPFRAPDIEADIAKQIAIREGFVRSKYTGQVDTKDATLIALKEQLAYHKHIADSNRDLAAYQASSAASVKSQIDFGKEHDKYLSKSVQMNREIAAAGEKYAAVAQNPANLAKYIESVKGIQEKFKESAAPKASSKAVVADTYALLIEGMDKANTAARREIITGEALSKSEKFRLDELYKIVDAYNLKKITVEQLIKAEARLEEVSANMSASESAIAVAKALVASQKELAKERNAAIQSHAKELESLGEKAQKLEDEVTMYGLSKSAIEELTTARMLDQIEVLKSFDNSSEEISRIEQTIAARKRLAAAGTAKDSRDDLAKASIAAAKKSADEWQKGWEETDQIAREAFVGWAENGTSMAEAIGKSLKKALLSAIYEATIRPIALQIYSTVMGNGAGASSGGGAMGVVNGVSSAYNVGGMASSGYSIGSQYFAGTMSGANAAGTIGGNMYAGMGAGDGLSGLLATNGAYGTAAGAGGSAAGATAATGTMSTAIPYIGAFIAAVMVLSQAGPTSARTLGSSKASYGADGELIGTEALDGLVHRPSDQVRADYAKELANPTPWQYDVGKRGPQESPNVVLERELASSLAFEKMSTGADVQAKNLAELYFNAAKTLDIKAAAASFSFASNTGQSGEHPNASFGVSIGGKSYNSGEAAFADPEVVKLSASRTILEALKASELPKYLSGVFDGLTTSTATQAQIDDTMKLATSYKTLHDQLQALPFEYLRDMSYKAAAGLVAAAGTMENLGSLLGGYYEAFYTSEEKKAQLTKNTTAAFEKLGIVMPALDESARAWYRSEVDRLGAMDMSVAANASAYTRILQLSGAMNTLVPALQDTAKTVTDTAKAVADAAKAFAEANAKLLASNLDAATTGATDAMSAVTRAVDAQKSQIEAAYTTQADAINASLSSVAGSIGKLQSLSDSLKSTLSGMRINGSDAQYRAAAQAQIGAALATARSGGGLPLDGQLASALATVSKPSEQLYGNFVDYARDFYKTANDISALGDLTGAQLTADQATQAILNAQLKAAETSHKASIAALDDILSNAQLQLDAANGINSSVLSVADALLAFSVSIGNLVTERTAQSLATSGASATADYMSSNADVKAAYAANSYGLNATDYANIHYGLYGASEGRASPVASTSGKSYFELYPDVAAAFAANSYGLSQVEYSARHFANFGKDEKRTYPGFAQGINYVPNDMTVRIHEGEAVVPKVYNPYNPNAQRSDDTAAALLAMADRLDRIEANTRATAGHTAGTDRKLARVIPGNALITEAA